MAFAKQVKSKSYFKRYQTRNRRRREGKTDYYQRRRLVCQDKNKYDSKKYRFVVRRTNNKVICQVIYYTMTGDKCMAQATSADLKKYGLEAGLTNYAACYATGLLCARRLLKVVKLDATYKGTDAADGKDYLVQAEGEKRPFKAALDVGLQRTTTGARVFASMKGAVDGGLNIPHNHKRFPGYSLVKEEVKGKRGKVQETSSEAQFDANVLREHIFGVHVQNYMDLLKKENAAKYSKQFAKWDAVLKKCKVSNLEALYKKVHSEIRKSPDHKKAAGNSKPTRKQISKENGKLVLQNSKGKKWIRFFKLTHAQRHERVQKRFMEAAARNQ